MASIGLRPPRPRHPSQPPSDTPTRRRPLAARCALLSFLWPGLGQIAGGARRRGIFLAVLTAALLLGVFVVVARQGRDTLIGEAVDTRVLAGLLAANGLIALYRLGAIADAARLGYRARGTIVTLSILTALVILPQAAAGWYAYTAYDTVTEVFEESEPTDVLVPVADEFDAPAATTPIRGPRAAGSRAAIRPRSRVSRGRPRTRPRRWRPRRRRRRRTSRRGASAAGSTSCCSAPTPAPAARGLRTDTMMVATIDLKTRRAAIFSVPRNMGGVPLPPRAARAAGARFPGILNALHGFGTAHPDLFPGGKDPGATALKQTLGQLTGLPIDYYVMVDFRGFHGLVDALGGVTLEIPHAVLDRVSPYEKGGEWIRIDLKPGRQHLTRRPGLRLRAGALDHVGLGAHQAAALRHRRARRRDRPDDGAAVVPRPHEDVPRQLQHRHPREAAAGAREARHVDPHEPGRLDRLHAARVHVGRHRDRRRDARHPGHPQGRPRRAQEGAGEERPAHHRRRCLLLMRIASVNVKLPPPGGTAIDKQPQTGPVAVTVDGLAGDGVGDTRHHGGPDQAVYAYGTPDYAWWEAELHRPLAPGTFGENLTIEGLESAGLAIGDRLVAGDVTLEVTSPRIPCATLAARMDDKGFIRRFRDARRPGVYLRVIEPGAIAVGDEVTVQPGARTMTVLELQDLFYAKGVAADRIERALQEPIDIRSRRDLERRLTRA